MVQITTMTESGVPFDKIATVEVDDAELDEAISWHPNHVDDEFDHDRVMFVDQPAT